jgi:lipoprotein NlpD
MRRTILVLVSVIAATLLVVTPALAAPAPQPASAPPAGGAPGYHVVRPGETLFSIGRRYGVSPWAIASANNLRNPNRIYAGQCLYIPPRCTTWYCGCPSYGCNWYRW